MGSLPRGARAHEELRRFGGNILASAAANDGPEPPCPQCVQRGAVSGFARLPGRSRSFDAADAARRQKTASRRSSVASGDRRLSRMDQAASAASFSANENRSLWAG